MKRLLMMGALGATLTLGGLVAAQTPPAKPDDHAAHHPEKSDPKSGAKAPPADKPGTMGGGMKDKGKGSHYVVLVGTKTTTLQSGEYTPFMVRRILNQLGIDPAAL